MMDAAKTGAQRPPSLECGREGGGPSSALSSVILASTHSATADRARTRVMWHNI